METRSVEPRGSEQTLQSKLCDKAVIVPVLTFDLRTA